MSTAAGSKEKKEGSPQGKRRRTRAENTTWLLSRRQDQAASREERRKNPAPPPPIPMTVIANPWAIEEQLAQLNEKCQTLLDGLLSASLRRACLEKLTNEEFNELYSLLDQPIPDSFSGSLYIWINKAERLLKKMTRH